LDYNIKAFEQQDILILDGDTDPEQILSKTIQYIEQENIHLEPINPFEKFTKGNNLNYILQEMIEKDPKIQKKLHSWPFERIEEQ